ncbi:aromatic acid exporter family protein [Streptomyces antimycoticus]|uniref:Aromatic acid exporter family protein n=3 Tax=Streptomyces TaxID=1883 RepID=A0ABN1DHJ1_9ACTN|nr:aromatic acid exporter family protein [Streptomyces antimycoticus]WJD95782.1 aromatic acid exporter family protein [Streptomyces antimycoticus]WTA85420.1 aromatic acid exporter family protein [Streptomyces antimycoticus]WTB04094.1 aromatic acid exporter family protein [Streptomyces antimycoticus]
MGHVIEKLYVLRAEARGIADAAARAWRGPGRERDLVVQSLKAAGAATLAWAVSGWWLQDPVALMAPWVAVVLVQATVYRSLFKGLQQLVAIAVGTLLAAGAEALTGNTLASVALVLPVVMLLSNWPRLGDQGIYGPTTALFTLTSGPVSGLTVSHRLLQALLGAAIGIAVNALVFPPVHLRNVRENLSRLARGTEETLTGIAEGLAQEDWSEDTAAGWRRLADQLQQRQESLRSARQWSHESLRLNPRLPWNSRRSLPLPSENEDQRWGAIVAQVGAVVDTMIDIADENRTIPTPDQQPLRDYGRLLADLASACRVRADLICVSAAEDAHARLDEALDSVERRHNALHKQLTDERSVSAATTAVLGTLLIQAQNIWHDIAPETWPRATAGA